MSSKNCSLAIDEVNVQSRKEMFNVDFEPELKIIVNKRFVTNSALISEQESTPVRIKGKITISF